MGLVDAHSRGYALAVINALGEIESVKVVDYSGLSRRGSGNPDPGIRGRRLVADDRDTGVLRGQTFFIPRYLYNPPSDWPETYLIKSQSARAANLGIPAEELGNMMPFLVAMLAQLPQLLTKSNLSQLSSMPGWVGVGVGMSLVGVGGSGLGSISVEPMSPA